MSGQTVGDASHEIAVRRAIYRRGLRFRLQGPPVPGTRRTADLEFRTAQVAVFLDGCFRHGCPEHETPPVADPVRWERKLEEIRRRDDDSVRRLATAGWLVIRVWEHEDPVLAAARVEAAVRSRAPVFRREIDIPATAVHGRISTYSNYRCRCDKCRQANADSHRALIARYRDEGGRGKHGTAYRYQTGCRCKKCRSAHAEADRDYRRRRQGHQES